MRKIIQNNLFLMLLFANSAWLSQIKAAAAAERDPLLAQANENLRAYARIGDVESAEIELDNGANPNMLVPIRPDEEPLSLLGYIFNSRMNNVSLSADQQNNLDRMIALLIERGADPRAEYLTNRPYA